MIPTAYVRRFEEVRQFVEGDNAPMEAHVGAAVLYDADAERPIEEVAQHARDMTTAHRYMADNEGALIVAVGRDGLLAGSVSYAGGLFANNIKRLSGPEEYAPISGVISCSRYFAADIANPETDPDLVPEMYIENTRIGPANRHFAIKPDIVTEGDIPSDDRLRAIGGRLLSPAGGVLAVGEGAVNSVIEAVIERNRGRKGAQVRRQAMWAVEDALDCRAYFTVEH